MSRWLLICALALFVADTSGLIPFVSIIFSVDDCCDDETAPPNCEPGCEHCTCCPHTVPVVISFAPALAPPGQIVGSAWSAEPRAPMIDPDEILDVPKPLA